MKKLKYLKIFLLLFDLLLIYMSFNISWQLRFFNELNLSNFSFNNFFSNFEYLVIFYIHIGVWIFLSFALDLFHVPRTTNRIRESFWKYIIYPQFIVISIFLTSIVFFNYDQIPRLFLLYFMFLQFIFLTFSKIMRSKLFKLLRISGYDLVGLGIISNNDDISSLNAFFEDDNKSGFYLKNKQLQNIFVKSLSDALELVQILNHSDFLIINNSMFSKKDLVKIGEYAENRGVFIYELINENNTSLLAGLIKNIKIGPINIVKKRRLPVKHSINVINKRIFDFIFSLTFLITIFWWLYIIISTIIKFQSKGPVLFKQKRVGIDGEVFTCYKFRTMHLDVTNSKKITQIGDKRIFSFGNFMRKTNLDEFPQFINVFNGDMSVVGPRPHMVEEDKMLEKEIDKYRMRRWVKPGITGYAAMKGFRGGTESMKLMQKRIDLDVEYIEKWNFLLDLKICYDTFMEIVLLRKKGH